jgi:hypothetical protein
MRSSKRRTNNQVSDKNLASVRASISFPPDICRTLEEIAAGKKVSLARVVPDAADQYVAEKWPLLRKSAR